MPRKRRAFTARFKSKVAMEALTERYTLSELAEKYEIHPNQISKWKHELIAGSEEVFEKKRSRKTEDHQELIDRLYRQIGQLQVELDWLKKKSGL